MDSLRWNNLRSTIKAMNLSLGRVPARSVSSLAQIACLIGAIMNTQDAPPPADTSNEITVRGRVTTDTGEPVAGAEVGVGSRTTYHGFGATRASEPKVGSQVLTGPEGQFTFTVDPLGVDEVGVRVTHPDFATMEWRLAVRAGEADYETSDLKLLRTVPIAIRVIDEDGNPLPEGWSLTFTETLERGHPRNGISHTVDAEDGIHRCWQLPGGKVRVSGRHAIGIGGIELNVDTTNGIQPILEVRYDGPDPQQTVRVLIRSGRLGSIAQPRPGTVRLIDEAGEEHPLIQEASQVAWSATGLVDGEYELRIEDSSFDDLQVGGLEPGTLTYCDLRGLSGLELRVHHSNEPVEVTGIQLHYLDGQFGGRWIRLLRPGQELPLNGVLDDLAPGTLELLISSSDRPPYRYRIEDLKPRETRTIEVDLSLGDSIAGRVHDENGEALPGVKVLLGLGEDIPNDHAPGIAFTWTERIEGEWITRRSTFRAAETDTNRAGYYQFDGLPPGEYTLRAVPSPWSSTAVGVTLNAETAFDSTPIEVFAMGDLELLVVLPMGVRAVDAAITVGQQDRIQESGPTEWGVNPDGRGRIDLQGLPAGTHDIRLAASREAGGRQGIMTRVVGSVQIEAGQVTSATIDLTHSFPVLALVDVKTSRGERPLTVRPVPEFEEGFSRALHNGHGRINGRHRFDLEPGSYLIRVDHSCEGWHWDSPEVYRWKSGETPTLDLTIELVTREVQIVDPQGKPLRGAFCYWTQHAQPGLAVAGSNEEGNTGPLHLPIDAKVKFAAQGRPDAYGEVTWTKGDGSLIVTIPDPPKDD